jgi:hypothetical protein
MMLIDSSKKKWATAHLFVFRPRCSQCEPGRNDRSAGSDSSKSLIIFEPSARCNAKTLVKNEISAAAAALPRTGARPKTVCAPLAGCIAIAIAIPIATTLPSASLAAARETERGLKWIRLTWLLRTLVAETRIAVCDIAVAWAVSDIAIAWAVRPALAFLHWLAALQTIGGHQAAHGMFV